MNKIQEITQKLFTINYKMEFESDDTYYKYLDIADELIKNNDWVVIYKCWYEYMINNCKDEESVLNFANLFWCYEGYKHYIYNAVEFCSFFYAKINFGRHPEADYLIDGITTEVFLNSGIISLEESYDYIPTNEQYVKDAIAKWNSN